jgi:hypothetical protein
MRFFRPALAVFALASLCTFDPAASFAATAAKPGSVQGVLKDPNGLAVTGLGTTTKVTFKNQATGEAFSAGVTLDGTFSLAKIPAGRYEVTLPIVSAMYMGYDQKDVEIVAGKALKLELPIAWGMNLGTIGDDPVLLGNDLRRMSKYVDGPTPRLADGHPDFSGGWFVISDATKGNRAPPMKPWAKAIADQVQAALRPGPEGKPATQYSAVYCLPQSATPEVLPFPQEFVQNNGRLVELNEFETPAMREIYLDGRRHPSPDQWNPSWYGHSVGHWEGDTLVVDSVGFNDITPGYGIHTEALHIVERLTRPSVGRILIDITATDERAWTGAHEIHYELGLVTSDEIHEWVCAENNATQHFGEEPWLKMIRRLMATAPAGVLEGKDAGAEAAKP